MNAIAKIHYIEYKAEQYLLALALITLGTLCGLYMYLVSSSVVHVVIKTEAEEKINQINGEIAVLEAEYMEMQQQISTKVIENKGYIAASKKIFIDREGVSLVTKR